MVLCGKFTHDCGMLLQQSVKKSMSALQMCVVPSSTPSSTSQEHSSCCVPGFLPDGLASCMKTANFVLGCKTEISPSQFKKDYLKFSQLLRYFLLIYRIQCKSF